MSRKRWVAEGEIERTAGAGSRFEGGSPGGLRRAGIFWRITFPASNADQTTRRPRPAPWQSRPSPARVARCRRSKPGARPQPAAGERPCRRSRTAFSFSVLQKVPWLPEVDKQKIAGPCDVETGPEAGTPKSGQTGLWHLERIFRSDGCFQQRFLKPGSL